MLANPATGFAAPVIPGFYGKIAPPATNTLPQVLTTYGGATVVTDNSTNTLTVNQNQGQSNVVIDWSSFNIGSSATVRFNQGTGTPGTASWKANTSYAVLNRINDQNPTLIYGKLLADGKVFLLNRNGILFGAGSQVNVHTLFASSLAMTLSNFNNNILSFSADSGTTPGAVSNSGTITTDDAGSVYLIAPNVENYGTIDARYGQIGLLAGSDVSLAVAPSAASGVSTIWSLVPDVKSSSAGTAVNRSTGRLNADSGMIGMYGATVEQDGIIRAVTAIKRNGEIQLKARDRIVTGAGSSTSTPISDSTEAVAVNTSDTSSTFSTGKISLGGLDTVATKRIEHYGAITAPSGTVTLNAEERVYLDSGSSIDVSGVWSDKQAGDATISSQLTSIILRDSYDQKNGVLKGNTITVSSLSGSSFGSLSDTIATQQMTARDRSTTGGSVTVQVTSGDLIAKEGSVLNISGGGFRYAAGTTSVTKLFSGNTVYDISTAPETITYSGLLGSFTQTSQKFGTTGTWTGLYLGGGTALRDYSQGYTQGSNAGSLTLLAGSLVLNSAIEAGVTRGVYQTLSAEQVDAYGLTKTSGLLEPTAGTLTIGVTHPPGSGLNDTMAISDAVTRQVVVAADTTSLSSSFDPETTPVDATKTTVLSSQILNAASLANLSINANTSITTEKDASIVLAAAGSFSAMARRIEHNGSITVPSGTVTLTAADNVTAYSDNPDKEFDASYTSKVYLATGSSISVAGEKVDNLAAKLAGNAIAPARTSGGTITVQDATDSDDGITTINGLGLVINKGAVLDVSGGYAIDTSGKMTGGDAGTLNLQGSAIIANGDFRGFSLPGRKGGTISLAADSVEVMTATPGILSQDFTTTTLLPEFTANGTGSPSEYLLIAGNRFADTGFATISLTSRNDLTVDSGVTIAPSRKKLQVPVSGSSGGSSAVAINNYATANGQAGSDGSVAFNDVGASSVALFAGLSLVGDSGTHATNDNASVTVAANSSVRVAPGGGTITIRGPAVNIAGTLDAPAGTISVTANTHDLTVGSGAKISAAGYDMPDATVVATGITAGYNPLNAGTVNLTANGNLVLEERSVVDVSGSAPVTVAAANGTAMPTVAEVASSPGTVNISYLGMFSNAGTLKAKRYQDNLTGGTLTVNSKGIAEGIEVSGDIINGYLASGFDSLKFQSGVAVNLSGAMDVSIGRGLTLDAPMITGSGSDTIKLSAPWIQIANSAAGRGPAAVDGGSGKATLELDSTWLDLTGDVVLNGFAKSYLTATRDIRLADLQYSNPTTRWSGRLATAGDLTLTADRIYTKMTETTINSDSTNGVDEIQSTPTNYSIDVGGKLTTMPSSDPTSGLPVYSAGGSLTITADGGFEHNGTILAPLGTITINSASSRVFLGQGSVLSTAGSTNVAYGYLDENSSMRTDDKTTPSNTSGVVVSEAPQKSITINGDTVIVKQGATIDISGGGSVSAYSFQAGIEGSTNPYTANGRMVVVAGNRYDLPGTAVYLNGGSGLAAGVYTILPASYAFLPGAYVIADMGTTKPGGTYQTTTGASVVSGYSTVAGTAISSNRLHYYSVWAASDLRQDGNFTTVSLAGNDAGSLAINANTAVLNGSINTSAPAGSNGGALTFGGTNLTVQTDVTTLAESFGFDNVLGANLINTFQVKSDYLTGKGLREITLGTDNTASITVAKGSALTAPEIVLKTSSAADSSITIGEGATIRSDKYQVIGTDGSSSYGGGSVTIASGGTVSIGPSATVYAGNDLNLETRTLSLSGSLKGNASTLNVSSGANNLILGTDSATDGLSLGDRFFSALSGFTSMSLASNQDVRIRNDFSLAVGDTLRIDAARMVADASRPVSATFSAKKFELLNSSNATAGADSPVGGGVLTFSGDSGMIGNGAIGISGFDTTAFNVTNTLSFLGKGSLNFDRGNLDITAAKITAGPAYVTTTGAYQAADFVVDSGTGTLALNGTGLSSSDSDNYLGGSLSFKGSKITSSATIELTAGQVSLTATGTEGVSLESGARISTPGYDYAAASDGTIDHEAGGSVTLRADNGPVTVAGGAVIDVSAPGAGDAGSVKLISAGNGVTVLGSITGSSTHGGQGGSFTIDSLSLDGMGGLGGLSTLLSTSGFNDLISIHSHSGDLTLANDKTLTGREVTITADNGNLTLDGNIDASGNSGGRVELNAGHDLTVNGAINAVGTAGKGGDVLLNVAAYDTAANNGTLTFAGTIDVSGSTGGTVAFRAPQTADFTDVNMTLNGTVAGASQVTAEAVKVHSYTGDLTVTSALQTTLNTSDVVNFLSNSTNVAAVTSWLSGGLGLDVSTKFSLLPGIELQSAGTIAFTADWNLSGAAWRVGGVQNGAPGVLTLRAAGDLAINYKLVDRYNTATINLSGTTGRPSWGLNLIAGSDLASSDLLAVKDNKLGTTGNLTIDGNNTGALVYTESGPIRFASFGDTVLGKGLSAQYMNQAIQAYTLASYSGSIRGETGGSLYVKGGAIEAATGDIALQVGADLNLYSTGTLGSIRTTGYSPQTYNSWWTYTGGGDINLDVAGTVNGQVDTAAWDLVTFNRTGGNNYYWSARFSGTPTAGLATMGGGNLFVRSGGDFDSQAGTFGNVASATGNLTILSEGDLTGRFNVSNGNGVIHAAGNIETTDNGKAVAIGAPGLGNLSVVAQGGVTLGTVYDPKIAASVNLWKPSYTSSSRFYANAVHGDLELTGTNPYLTDTTNLTLRNAILPPSLFLFSGNDILLENSIFLAPSLSGNLQIDAGRDVSGSYVDSSGNSAKALIIMTDIDPDQFYASTSATTFSSAFISSSSSAHVHNNTRTQRDSRPISITADRGDLKDIQIGAPKAANLHAYRDIRDIYYVGQNLSGTDISTVSAGRDILFSSTAAGSTSTVTGLEQDGPGALLVQAGRNIDLGTSAGITTKGNAYNSALDSTKGSDLYVVAGAASTKTPDSIVKFFDGDTDNNIKGLQEYGIEYSELKAQGDTAGAQQRLDEARTLLIDRFFGGQTDTGIGTINMTSSQISTLAGKDNIYIMARGQINVGKTALILNKTIAAKKQANTGIYTAKGGAIDIYSGGDLNVNESRVMSFQGGDLTLWSDHGNVNAGRGSKTTISSNDPTLSKNQDGTYSYVFSPPAVGSGIRTLTYASKLGEPAPEAGNIYVFAPEGNIDAGEAGIAGNKVVLGATEVLNSQNITAGVGSVGVPSSSGSSVSIVSFSGTSGLADSSKMIEQTAGVGAARDALKSTTQVLDDFMSKFLDVKVISFDSDPGDDGNVKDKDKDKK